jgi:hypothetical protein
VIHPAPVTLERNGVRLEPMSPEHAPGMEAAAADGELWKLWFTSVPDPGGMPKYIDDAVKGMRAGHMLPWVVRDLASRHRTHINTTCKLLLLAHAFDTLGCKVVGLRTDNFNFRSQRAIEALGAKKDGVIRHHWPRRDGTVRDSVLYSILATEWPDVRRHLEMRLARHKPG